jgi:hypothetical protein
MIPTKLHGILDYIVASILIAFPWIFGTFGDNAEIYVPITLGMMTIVYSLCTRYELGVFKIVPMNTHLVFDLVQAILLASSPWLFKFIDRLYLPYLIAGFLELFVIVLSKKTPQMKTV